MKEVEQETYSIIPFTSNIVGVKDGFVFIKEYEDSEEVLKVKKKDFIKMTSLWLDSKDDYASRYGHFCGAFGNFYIEKFEKDGEIDIVSGFDETAERLTYKKVPIYRVTKFDKECDMEHG